MPKYSVLVTRNATESAQIEVTADNEERAEELALVAARADGPTVIWTTDEGNYHDSYLCDPGNCATEIE